MFLIESSKCPPPDWVAKKFKLNFDGLTKYSQVPLGTKILPSDCKGDIVPLKYRENLAVMLTQISMHEYARNRILTDIFDEIEREIAAERDVNMRRIPNE